MSAFLILVALVAAATYAAYRHNLERNWSEYHIAHSPASGCVECEGK